MIDLLRPPIFDDEDKTLNARLLFTITWTFMLAVWISIFIALILPETTFRWLLLIALIESTGLIILILSKYGYILAATNILIITTWAAATAMALTGGGIRSNAMAIYVITVLIAGILQNGKAGIASALLCILTSLFLVYIESKGFLPYSHITHTSLTLWLSYTAYMTIIMVLQFLVSRTIRESLKQSRQELKNRLLVDADFRKSNQKYQELVENANSIILRWSRNGEITFMNEFGLKFFGYTEEEILGRQVIGTIVPENESTGRDLRPLMDKIKSNPKDFEQNINENMCRSGDRVWISWTNKAVLDSQGQVLEVLSIGSDITERKLADKKLQETIESLRKSFSATIQVMVSAVEMKDPYTAGHQIRVADLAKAIATEMGLPQDKIEGLRMAGSIHDIGKLSVPAEILSKPTKLTNIEFNLIKEHSQSGYDILKNVESPWPLAEIVYQHHELMNGSGYPRNLKGDEIIMESRVLAVADVVEAMASHRPYRPTLGIEAALEEIEKNKGILYDNTVADACLRLFREKRYQLT